MRDGSKVYLQETEFCGTGDTIIIQVYGVISLLTMSSSRFDVWMVKSKVMIAPNA